MKILKSVSEADLFVKKQHSLEKEICLIPTMGTLHDGHLELIKQAPNNSSKVVTIYINHLQFDDENDYLNYPKNINQDIELCKKNNVEGVFMPEKDCMINLIDNHAVDLPKFTKYMCGGKRNGHFLGVYKIVKALFALFNPNYACFGKKDFQQLLLIKYIAKTHFQNLKIIDVNTIRNIDNIALSSRLSRLNEMSLIKARLIYETLLKIKSNLLGGLSFDSIKEKYISELENKDIRVEYIDLRLLDTLEVSRNQFNKSAVFIACYVDEVRLIDNIEI